MNVKIRGHEDLVGVSEGVKYGVKEEVGDRSEGEEACNGVCVECRRVKIWVMRGMDESRGWNFNGEGS